MVRRRRHHSVVMHYLGISFPRRVTSAKVWKLSADYVGRARSDGHRSCASTRLFDSLCGVVARCHCDVDCGVDRGSHIG